MMHLFALRRRLAWLALGLVVALAAAAALPGLTPVAFAKDGNGGKGHFLPPGLAKKGFGGMFRDLHEASWALPYLEAMWRLSILQGYADLTLRPNKPVTQAEALVMLIRALGLEDEALAASAQGILDLNDDDDDDEDEDDEDEDDDFRSSGWAAGYIAVAVKHGLIDDARDIRPNKPATRAWIAALLVRAARVDEDLEDALTFVDADEIPLELQAMVRLAVHLGWFQGYPGNFFKPNKPVTRAEMAVILLRFLGYEGAPTRLTGMVRGTLTEVDEDELTIETRDGREVTYPFADEVDVFIDGRPAELDDLEPGMSGWAWVVSGMVIQVSVRSDDDDDDDEDEDEDVQAFEVTGTLEDVDATGTLHVTIDGRRYQVDADVQVFDTEGDPIDFEDLEVGWTVEASGEVRDGTRVVTRIEVEDEAEARTESATLYGIVERSDHFELDVVFSDGDRDRDLEVPEDVRVYEVDEDGDEVDLDLAELKAGDSLELIYVADELDAIRRTGAGRQEIGIITDLDLSGSAQDLTIDRDFDADDEDLVSYRFAGTVDVSDSVSDAVIDALDELEEGYVVTVTLTAGDRLIAVLVTDLEP